MQNHYNWPLWHWHFEPSSICTLHCPRCPRNEFPETLVQTQLSLQFFKDNFDFDGIRKITFCGDDGDPIYAKEFLDIVSWFKQKDPTVSVNIVTNGSYKTPEWWQNLGSALNEYDQIHFSFDGWDQASNENYRVNCDWDSAVEGARTLRTTTDATMIWDAIAFRFNEDHIDYMRSLAEKWKFDQFQLTLSTKFGSKYSHYNTVGIDPLEPSQKFISGSHRFERKINNLSGRRPKTDLALLENIKYYNNVKQLYKDQPIVPLCMIGTKGMFVNSQGYLLPCCWLGNRYNDVGGEQFYIPENNIKSQGLENVLNSKHWDGFIKQFNSLRECKNKCTSSIVNKEYATNW